LALEVTGSHNITIISQSYRYLPPILLRSALDHT